jgi:hypothetical protein
MWRKGSRCSDTATPQHRNTATPQHRNTATPQHRNTATPQHRIPFSDASGGFDKLEYAREHWLKDGEERGAVMLNDAPDKIRHVGYHILVRADFVADSFFFLFVYIVFVSYNKCYKIEIIYLFRYYSSLLRSSSLSDCRETFIITYIIVSYYLFCNKV